jgi:biopolymer transport protein ExbD
MNVLACVRATGAVLILASVAWSGGWLCWKSSRIWKPLDVPVSLQRGHIQSKEFQVNVASSYSFGILVRYQTFYDSGVIYSLGVAEDRSYPSVLKMRWTIRGRSGEVSGGSSDAVREVFGTYGRAGRAIGVANLPPGWYVLDIENLEDGSRLDAVSPHLALVETGGALWRLEDEESQVKAMPVALAALLVIPYLLLRPLRLRYEERLRAAAHCTLTEPGPQAVLAGSRMVPPEVAENRRLYRTISIRIRHAEMRAPFQWPCIRWNWAVQNVVIFLTLLVVISTFLQAATRIIPVGLMVRLVRPDVKSEPNPVIAPILIYIRRTGELSAAVLVNSREVAWNDLDATLRRELLLRPLDWPIYVEGDRNLAFQWPARAIDVVQGLHVPVVLLTR